MMGITNERMVNNMSEYKDVMDRLERIEKKLETLQGQFYVKSEVNTDFVDLEPEGVEVRRFYIDLDDTDLSAGYGDAFVLRRKVQR